MGGSPWSWRLGLHEGTEGTEGLAEATTAQSHGPFILVVGNCCSNGTGFGDTLHQGSGGDTVFANTDDTWLTGSSGAEQLLNRIVAEQRTHPAVEGAGHTTPLDVAQDGDTGIFTKALFKNLFDLLGSDGVTAPILSPLSNHDQTITASMLTPDTERITHRTLPIIGLGGRLGDKDPIGAAGDCPHQGEIATVAAHHLDHKGALVARSGRGDRVDRLGDAVQCRIGTNRHIGTGKIVINRANQTNNGQEGVALGRFRIDGTGCVEFSEKIGPLTAEDISTGKATITTNDDEVANPMGQQVCCSLEAPLAGAKARATRRTDDRTTTLQDTSNTLPIHAADEITTADHALVAFVDRKDLTAAANTSANNGAHCSIHSLGITTTGQ